MRCCDAMRPCRVRKSCKRSRRDTRPSLSLLRESQWRCLPACYISATGRDAADDSAQTAEPSRGLRRRAFRFLHSHSCISRARLGHVAEPKARVANLREHQVRVEAVVSGARSGFRRRTCRRARLTSNRAGDGLRFLILGRRSRERFVAFS